MMTTGSGLAWTSRGMNRRPTVQLCPASPGIVRSRDSVPAAMKFLSSDMDATTRPPVITGATASKCTRCGEGPVLANAARPAPSCSARCIAQKRPIGEMPRKLPPRDSCAATSTQPEASARNSACEVQGRFSSSSVAARIVTCEWGGRPMRRMRSSSSINAGLGEISSWVLAVWASVMAMGFLRTTSATSYSTTQRGGLALFLSLFPGLTRSADMVVQI